MVPSHDFGNIGGFVHSHRFAAANTAVPTSYGDKEQVAVSGEVPEGVVTVDIFGLAREPAETSEELPACRTGRRAAAFQHFCRG